MVEGPKFVIIHINKEEIMKTIHKHKMSFKEVVEKYLEEGCEVIFMKDNKNIGEITKHTPYKVVNLYQEIFAHIKSPYVTEIGNRRYVEIY